MDEYPNAINNEPVNQKPNRLHALAFLKIGIFKVGFAAVILFLLFGTLNYFNILPISNLFPKFLSWLPRQNSQPKIVVNKTVSVPLPTPPTPKLTY